MKKPELVIKPGMIYEDCSYHPVLCVDVIGGDDLIGISLIDASWPRSCSLRQCGVVELTISDVVEARQDFDAYVARRTLDVGTEG
jgi:hypothetical protein